jgi:replicative DNA helicase
MNAMTEMQYLRTPPHSLEAESAVLGALMLDNRAWDTCADVLASADFFRCEHQVIFSCIAGLLMANKSADVIAVFERLQADEKADHCGGLAYLHSLAQYVPSAANLRAYSEIVKERAVSRKLVNAGNDIQALGFDQQEPIADRLDKATASLTALIGNGASTDWVEVDSMVVSFLDNIEQKASGAMLDNVISTGLRDLDEILEGGFRPGQLIIIAARPSIGKSALAVNCTVHSTLQGKKEGFFSLEMPKEELTQRIVSGLSHVHLSKIRKAKNLQEHDWPRMIEAIEQMRGLPLYIAEQASPNINQIRAKARLLRRKYGLDKLTIDYIGLTSGTNPKEPRHQQLGEVTRGLKGLAKELNIPIIALAQLSRGLEQRTNGRPMLSDLKDSGDIEQDADVVIFIDRPYHTNNDLGQQWEHYAELIVAKHRNGATGSINARYVGGNVQFLNWDGAKPEKLGAKRTGSNL